MLLSARQNRCKMQITLAINPFSIDNLSMNILMVTSETVPFSKSGGLADVVGALSSALAGEGHFVKVFMPMYSFIEEKGFKKSSSFSVPMISSEEKVETVEKKLGKVIYVGLKHPYFTDRKGIYGDTSFTPYADNCPRFMLFAKAVGLYMNATGFDADCVHCHDWTAGLVPYYLKAQKIKAKTMFTIHNLAYQGDFSVYDALLSGDVLSDKLFTGPVDSKRLNMLKAGLDTSDIITTVSPTYAIEIQGEEFGCGLDWLLRARKDDLYGIINGIDYKEWNPGSDVYFEEHFNSRSLNGKAQLKAKVQKDFGLEVREDIPLFSMISRLAEQKGFGELLLSGSTSALERILSENDVQFIVVGTGDQRYVDKLNELQAKYPNLSVRIVFSNKIAHMVEGASDFFLMPSRYEPCGLNQLYSEHYGTLPIAHKTGGLADTIQDINEKELTGTGFLFSAMHPDDIVKACDRAIDFYKNKEALKRARKLAMTMDFTWNKSASEYEKLYNKLAQGKNGGNK